MSQEVDDYSHNGEPSVRLEHSTRHQHSAAEESNEPVVYFSHCDLGNLLNPNKVICYCQVTPVPFFLHESPVARILVDSEIEQTNRNKKREGKRNPAKAMQQIIQTGSPKHHFEQVCGGNAHCARTS